MKKEKNKKNEVRLFEWRGIHLIILFAVPFLLYAQTFSFDFSYHDDDTIVLYNSKSLENFDVKKFFFTDAWMMDKQIELYRPMQSLSYAVDHFFSGNNAKAYHIQNVVLFCIGILLLYLFLLSLSLNEQQAFFLSLLYSVHFLFAHTVSWIPARGDLYLFAFSIATFLLFYLFLRKQKIIYCLLASLTYFGALLSKESAMVVVPLLYATAILIWKMDWKKISNYFLLLPSVVLTALYLWMRSQSIMPVTTIFSIDGFIYNLPMIPEEVFKFFVPLFFSVMPAFSTVVTLGGTFLIAAIGTLIFLFRKKINFQITLLGTIFFLLPLLPAVVYKPAFTGFAYDYLDHRMFFPGIGLLLIAFAIFDAAVEKKLSVTIFYILITAMAIITFYNTTNYKNYISYYENATATNLKSGLAHSNYGASLARENKYDQALIQFKKSVELSPENIEVRMKLADSYYTLKDYKLMINECKQVIKINPKYPKSYYNIALVFAGSKKTDSTFYYVNKAVQMDSANADALFYRGLIDEMFDSTNAALHDYNKLIQLNAKYASAYFKRGNIYGHEGKYKEAFQDYDTYVQLNPNDGYGYFYRGQAACLLGNKNAGCEDFHIALQMGITEVQSKIDYWCK